MRDILFLLRFKQPDVAQYGVLCKRSLCKPLRMRPQDISIATCIRVITCTTVSLRFQRPSSVPQTKPQTRNRSLSAITTRIDGNHPSPYHVTCNFATKNSSPIQSERPGIRRNPARLHTTHRSDTAPSLELTGATGSVCRYVFVAQTDAQRGIQQLWARDSLTGGRSWRRFIFSRGATVPSAPREVESGA
jgi:hypothetical protein